MIFIDLNFATAALQRFPSFFLIKKKQKIKAKSPPERTVRYGRGLHPLFARQL